MLTGRFVKRCSLKFGHFPPPLRSFSKKKGGKIKSQQKITPTNNALRTEKPTNPHKKPTRAADVGRISTKVPEAPSLFASTQSLWQRMTGRGRSPFRQRSEMRSHYFVAALCGVASAFYIFQEPIFIQHPQGDEGEPGAATTTAAADPTKAQ